MGDTIMRGEHEEHQSYAIIRLPRVARTRRRCRELRPSLLELEERVVLSSSMPGITGITFDTAGDVFVSYNSTVGSSTKSQSVAEFNSNGHLVNSAVFTTTGSAALPGALTSVGSSSLPSISSTTAILKLQPDGQLFVFDPVGGTSSQYDNLASYTANAANVYDLQTGAYANLSSLISLTGATFGDFGVYDSSLVVSAESNNWDFVLRLTYGSSGGAPRFWLPLQPATGFPTHPRGLPSTRRERC